WPGLGHLLARRGPVSHAHRQAALQRREESLQSDRPPSLRALPARRRPPARPAPPPRNRRSPPGLHAQEPDRARRGGRRPPPPPQRPRPLALPGRLGHLPGLPHPARARRALLSPLRTPHVLKKFRVQSSE